MQLKNPPFAALILTPALALAACIPPSPEPTPAPTPAPTTAPTPAPAVIGTQNYDDWMDRPITPGDWTYISEQSETLALFGTDQSAANTTLVMRCNLANRRVGIGRMGNIAGQAEMRIRTETVDRALTASTIPAAGTSRGPIITAELAASDPLLDAIAFSNGRFMLQVAGHSPVIAPAWPEITRVIEDCRK